MARDGRLNKRGGGVAILVRNGVAILVRNGINYDAVNPIPTSRATSNEQLTITIQTTTRCWLTTELSREIVEGLCLGRDNAILTGDFNSKHESFGNKTRTSGGTLLQEITDGMKLTITNDNTPTHTCDSTNDKDILDLVFISPLIIPHFRDTIRLSGKTSTKQSQTL